MSKKGGHHGGSWKVAYADFVTAMMAFFMVMWLASQDIKIKEAIQRSFTNPFSSLTKQSTGIIPNQSLQTIKTSSGNFDSSSVMELAMLRSLNEDLMKAVDDFDDEDQESMSIQLSHEGLRISLFDKSKKPVFEKDSDTLTEYGEFVLWVLSWQIARHEGFNVEVEGHTEAGYVPADPAYTAWELSADRANRARRTMVGNGIVDTQIRKVAGYADTMPMRGTQPTDDVNRRVDILLKVRDR